MNHGRFPLSKPVPVPSDETDGFIDLDRLLAAAKRQMKVVALFGVAGDRKSVV